MSDLLRCLAFAFRRKGTGTMPTNDLRMLVAFDLNWFAPADAKRFVDRALQGGFVIEENGVLRIAFDPAAIEVPLNFKPNAAALLEEPFPDMPTARPPKTVASPPPAPPAAPAATAAATHAAPTHAAPTHAAPTHAAPTHAAPTPTQAAPAPAAAVARAPAAPPVDAAAPEPLGDAADVERAKRGGLLDIRVARLIVARREGEDVKPKLAEIERAILGR